jgi:hypothetical protein
VESHTDLLAHLTGARRVAMMFYREALRVVLATIHVPSQDVPQLLTQDLLESVIELSARELSRFGYATPSLALAGLNPAMRASMASLAAKKMWCSARRRGVPGARHQRQRAVAPRTRYFVRPRAACSDRP